MQLTPDEFLPVFERFKRERNLPGLKLGDSIGFGGFSTVFDLTDGKRQLVLKVISSVGTIAKPEKAIQYVHSERDAMLKCRGCDHVMPLLDYYEYPVSPQDNHWLFFFVMPKLKVLTEHIKSKGVSEQLIVAVTRDVCEALSFCEQNQILHRDIKHSNIYVRYGANNDPSFLLGDFGVARDLPGLNGPVTGIGSFIAPEIHMGQPLYGRYNSDIYSLGMTLFFLTTTDYAAQAFKKNPPAEFSPALRRVMIRCVEPDPALRYQHAREVIDELDGVAVSSLKRAADPDTLVPVCKCALLDKDPKKALELAAAGHAAGSAACSRLYAYTMFSLYRSDKNKTTEALRILRTLIADDDDTARCLYALIGLDVTPQGTTEADEYLRQMAVSAENGCEIARYYYGRWLFDGQMGLPTDAHRGMDLLIRSVKQNFAPSLLYLKTRLENHDDRFQFSQETVNLLNTELNGFNKTKIAEAIVMAI